ISTVSNGDVHTVACPSRSSQMTGSGGPTASSCRSSGERSPPTSNNASVIPERLRTQPVAELQVAEDAEDQQRRQRERDPQDQLMVGEQGHAAGSGSAERWVVKRRSRGDGGGVADTRWTPQASSTRKPSAHTSTMP